MYVRIRHLKGKEGGGRMALIAGVIAVVVVAVVVVVAAVSAIVAGVKASALSDDDE